MIDLIEELNFQIALNVTPIVLDDYAYYGYTVNNLTLRTPANTADVTLNINGTPITGLTAITGSSTIAAYTASAANTLVVGNNLTMTVNSATATYLYGSLKLTRT